MSKTNPNEKFKSKIGGQALIEGVMMRGIDKEAMSCRMPDGSIQTECWDVKSIGKNAPWYKKTPFVRGSINFVSSLIDGYKCLTKSAEKQGNFEDEELNKFEKWLVKKFGDNLMKVFSIFSIIIGVVLCIGIFMYLPMFLTKLIMSGEEQQLLKTLIEGLIKVVLLIGYLFVISKMKDIQRTYEYHGAEHKTIACYEAGEELTPENVKKYIRFHPRCGTSFLLIVMLISILVFSVVTWETLTMRIVLKLALLPVVCGIAYEIIKLAGRYDNIVTRIISAPGLWLQRLTTREPDEKEIECAIAAFNAVKPVYSEEDRW